MTPKLDYFVKKDYNNSNSAKQEINNQQYSNDSGSSFQLDIFSALRMRFLRQEKCDAPCDCNCHTHTRTQTPQMLQPLLGALFVGYTGLPALTPSCSNVQCRRSSEGFLQIDYYFPPWFLARIVSMVMRFKDSKIPDISMRVLNVRSAYEAVFSSAFEGDAKMVRYLLTMGQASVLDVTQDSGHSLLHVGTSRAILGPDAKSWF